MAQKVKEKVEDAVASVQEVVQHGKAVNEFKAPPRVEAEGQRLESALNDAERSLEEVERQGERASELVADPAVAEAVEAREEAVRRSEQMEQEEAFREAEKPLEMKHVFEDAKDVQEHSDALDRKKELKNAIKFAENAVEKGQISETRKDARIFGVKAKMFFGRVLEGMAFTNKIAERRKNARFAERNEGLHKEVLGSMESKRKYMGEDAYAQYRETPTVIATIDLPGDYKFGEKGVHFRGSNGIAIDREAEGVGDARQIIRHEEYHRAAAVAGGRTVRWREANGDAVVVQDKDSSWFHEGLTEYLSQRDERGLGNTPSEVSYRNEVITAAYLEHVVGREELETAYFQGDFSKVREIVDGKLGEGSFAKIARATDGVEGRYLMENSLIENNIDYSAWEQEPIVADARKRVEM